MRIQILIHSISFDYLRSFGFSLLCFRGQAWITSNVLFRSTDVKIASVCISFIMIFCGLLCLKLIVRKSITYSTSLASTPDRDSSKKLDHRSIILQLLLLLASYLISIVYFSYCPKSARASCFSLLTSSS